MTRWETGQKDVEAMVAAGDLEQVAPSAQNAARLLAEAERHLRSAELVAEADPAGGYDLLYAAARKSMAAALAVQGLRATSKGGHIAVQEAVTAQLGRSGAVVRPFGRLRRTRNDADYPRLDTPELGAEDIAEDLPKAKDIVAAMQRLLPHLQPW
ncbi:hypothetical protein [Phycicoccus sonneratiae]|uniref:HEPN domain-containing protein n=1 Tax=Phycicoccus sonneratiae TaxID=2807628 RepID=A0ABS2CNH1_9MICO|nr:hypothetical protein [Phycicoccus sonneraticus]MBM6401429.1 hypothetical protein [Phycicoccus sonneraticus]